MVKYFCDMCGKQITRSANRKTLTLTEVPPGESETPVIVDVELLVSINGTANGGHICLDCIKKVVADGEVRVR